MTVYNTFKHTWKVNEYNDHDQLANSIGPHVSDRSYCCFDSAVYYSHHPHLAFGSWMPPFGSCHPRIQLPPFHFGFSVQWLPFPKWGLIYREEQSQSFSRMPQLPSQIYFLKWWRKVMPFGLLECEWVGLKWSIHLNVPISLSLWIPSSSLNQSISSFSNLLMVGHLLVRASANQLKL